jgi:hypothetical protein
MLSAAAVAPQPLRGAETVSIAQALAFAYAGNPALGASSLAFYARVVGQVPGTLRFPPLSKQAPPSLDAALAIADRGNPNVLAAAFNEEAARHNIDLVRGELLPEVSINAQYAHDQQPSDGLDWNEQGAVFGQVTMPIYEGGQVYSRIREAKQTASQRALEILDIRRQVRQRSPNPGTCCLQRRRRSARPGFRSRPTARRFRASSRNCGPAHGRSSTCSMPSRNWSIPRCCWPPPSVTASLRATS